MGRFIREGQAEGKKKKLEMRQRFLRRHLEMSRSISWLYPKTGRHYEPTVCGNKYARQSFTIKNVPGPNASTSPVIKCLFATF